MGLVDIDFMLANNRLKLTAHLANFLSARSLALALDAHIWKEKYGDDMELRKITFKLEEFNLAPEAERVLLIQLSLFANEISMLHKMIIFSNNHKNANVELTAQNIQSFFLIKLLAGKLYEGWQMLQKTYYKQKLSRKFNGKLSRMGTDRLKYINLYFGKTNVISLIRNKYAFHYDYDRIRRKFSTIPADEYLDLYIAPDHGNSLYAMAHIISSYALFDEVDSSDDFKALDKIFKDVLGVANKFLMFTGELFGVIWAANKIPASVSKVNLDGIPNIKSIVLPYFILKK